MDMLFTFIDFFDDCKECIYGYIERGMGFGWDYVSMLL